MRLFDFLLRPQLTINNLLDVIPELRRQTEYIEESRREEILEAAEILIKYSGYIDRERMVADKLQRLDYINISDKFDYSTIQSLSTEARQKLNKIRPQTIGQASRIPGISPNDINVLLVMLGR
jgi:tRNA uridine 5-carboxymethylaminomethyl modification enzyme